MYEQKMKRNFHEQFYFLFTCDNTNNNSNDRKIVSLNISSFFHYNERNALFFQISGDAIVFLPMNAILLTNHNYDNNTNLQFLRKIQDLFSS